ncbi:MAG: helix-turn-helix domain-containing protein [Pelomonas sp.]|nr:helix-turn-helix domain-containing protein [Roseateles sp.]
MTNNKPIKPARAPRGIQSVEVGGRLLLALVERGRAMALKDLAAAAGMTAAKAHPYLVSFGKLGLVEQDEAGARYGLGPLAVQLGLIALQQVDPLRLASERAEALAAALGHTVAIVVWGDKGPTVVRVAEAPSPVHITMRHGAVMSLRDTASGRVFAAQMDAPALRAALKQAGERHALDADYEALLGAVRADGLASTRDTVVRGVAALAAPVFDAKGGVLLCLTAIGPSGHLDLDVRGAVGSALRAAAAELARAIGPR